jgi:hypothetical protein
MSLQVLKCKFVTNMGMRAPGTASALCLNGTAGVGFVSLMEKYLL